MENPPAVPQVKAAAGSATSGNRRSKDTSRAGLFDVCGHGNVREWCHSANVPTLRVSFCLTNRSKRLKTGAGPMIRWFGDMSRAKALNGWELLESRRLLALTDPIGDADQDLVFAEVVAVADELEITVRFAAGTFDMAKSNFTVSLDTDQDASTGHPGIDSGGTIDGEILGSEFIISNSGVDRSAARLLAYTGPPINTFSFRDSQPITFLRDGIRVRFPLASLDRDDGLVNFKVTSSEQLDDTGSTGILDVMPNVGLAPGSSEIESSFVLYGTTVPNGDNADSLVRLEPATGAQKLIGAAGGSPGTTSIDWNPATGTLFGVDESQSPGVISEINPATGIATPLATILDQRTPARITNVSFSPDGTMWGSVGDTSIGTIDLISQEYKPVIAAPNGEFIFGMDISPDGTLYIAHSNLGAASQTLTSIDLATTEILNELSIGSLNVDDIDYAPDGFIYHTNFSFALVRLDPSTGQQTIVGFGDLSALAGIASTSINGPPAITSNPFASVPENTISVMTVTVTDPDGDTPVLSISGGADAASFTIGNSNGVLNFASTQTLKNRPMLMETTYTRYR